MSTTPTFHRSVCYCGAYGGGVHTKSARCDGSPAVETPGPVPSRDYQDGWFDGVVEAQTYETTPLRPLLDEARGYVESFASLTKHPTAGHDALDLVGRIRAALTDPADRSVMQATPPPTDGTDAQLAEDQRYWGTAYCRIDADGTKTRIDPREVMIAPLPKADAQTQAQALRTTLVECAVRGLAVGPNDHAITLQEILAIRAAADEIERLQRELQLSGNREIAYRKANEQLKAALDEAEERNAAETPAVRGCIHGSDPTTECEVCYPVETSPCNDLAVHELRNIADANLFDRDKFASATEFGAWAQSRARFTLEKCTSQSEAKWLTAHETGAFRVTGGNDHCQHRWVQDRPRCPHCGASALERGTDECFIRRDDGRCATHYPRNCPPGETPAITKIAGETSPHGAG